VVKLFAGTLLLALRWSINLLSLGELDARALDVNVDVLRWVLSGLAAMIAAQVFVSGGVGWVRLIVPHLARLLVWPDRSRLLPTAVVLGGLYHLATAMYSQCDRPGNTDWPSRLGHPSRPVAGKTGWMSD
jgi:iron complex transport system permease protein